MSSEVALESVNSRIDLGGKSGKSFATKKEGGVGFHNLVSEKKESSKEKSSKQDATSGQVQREKVLVKESITPKTEQSEAMKNQIVQIEQQEVIVPQILPPELMLVKIEVGQELQEAEEGEEAEQLNADLEDNSGQLRNEEVASLIKAEHSLTDVSAETLVVSGDTEITKEKLEENEKEVATLEVNVQQVIVPIIQNDNKTFSSVKNSSDEASLAGSKEELVFKDSTTEEEVNFAEFKVGEEEEALLARLSSQNFKSEIKVAEQSKPNQDILAGTNAEKVAETSEGKVEIAVKLERGEANADSEISQDEVKIAKLATFNNINTIFADTSRAGQEIWAAMRGEHKKNISELMNEELVAAASLPGALEEVEIYAGLENNNNSNSKFAAEIFSFGGAIETNQDGKLVVSFKENLVAKSDTTPHRSEQIALSIKEAASSGKSNVTINMYPKALGAIDIHIEFSMVGGKQVVESIRITAERRDTLDIIQKSEAELRKNLTEVTKSSEDASLEFNLKHNDGNGGKGNYFQDLEERQNWMNKFHSQTDKVAELNSATGYSDQNSYITEDSVNIIA